MNNKKVPRVHWHKRLRYWFEWLGVAFCVRIIPLLPLALLRLLADLAGWLAFALDRKGRAVALANLQAAFGEERNLSDRKNDRLTPIFRRLREISGQTTVTQELSMIRFLKMLLPGTPVGILADLTMKMSQPAVIIRAFGLRMRVTMMHTILHKRTNALIQPFITLLQPDGQYMVRLLEPFEFGKEVSYQRIAQICWERFEPTIRQRPEHWLWLYKHWRYRPVEDAGCYSFYANCSEKFERELA